MAFKINRDERKRIDILTASLATMRAEIGQLVEGVNARLAEYNETLEMTRGVIDDIFNERDEEWGEKSERWQEGDTGGRVREWLDGLESIRDQLEDLEEIELGDDEDAATLLNEQLADEPSDG